MKSLMKYGIFLLKVTFWKWKLLNSFNLHFQWLPAKPDPGTQLEKILLCASLIISLLCIESQRNSSL